MKVEVVSALRERELRPVGRVAEPPVVGLAPRTTNERKANNMKKYILRDLQTVEPQTSRSRTERGRLARNGPAPRIGRQTGKIGASRAGTLRADKLTGPGRRVKLPGSPPGQFGNPTGF